MPLYESMAWVSWRQKNHVIHLDAQCLPTLGHGSDTGSRANPYSQILLASQTGFIPIGFLILTGIRGDHRHHVSVAQSKGDQWDEPGAHPGNPECDLWDRLARHTVLLWLFFSFVCFNIKKNNSLPPEQEKVSSCISFCLSLGSRRRGWCVSCHF